MAKCPDVIGSRNEDSPGCTLGRKCGLGLAVRASGAAPLPDDRYNADILVVVAHPDDETMVTGYLARAIDDLGKRVAVVFGTRGDAGGNAKGNEQAAALGLVREIEAPACDGHARRVQCVVPWRPGYAGPGCAAVAGNVESRRLPRANSYGCTA